MLTCLPGVRSLRVSDGEQTPGATGSAPQEFREGLMVLCVGGDLDHFFARL